ncbi:hypothetical protein GCM10023405_20030 [Streptomonospora salina]
MSRQKERFPYGAFVADPSTADRSITSFFPANEPGHDVDTAYLAAERGLDLGAVEVRSWRAGSRRKATRPAGRVAFRAGHQECGCGPALRGSGPGRGCRVTSRSLRT